MIALSLNCLFWKLSVAFLFFKKYNVPRGTFFDSFWQDFYKNQAMPRKHRRRIRMSSDVKNEYNRLRLALSFVPDPGWKRYDEAVASCGLPNSWLEICRMLDAAESEEEKRAICKKLPMKPLDAIFLRRKMGKDTFLAAGYNLEYSNDSLGGPDWVDRY
jgi:hypothetical protein